MAREKVGALIMLMFSIAYGLLATRIPLTFLAQQETLPPERCRMHWRLSAPSCHWQSWFCPPPMKKASTALGKENGRDGLAHRNTF